MSSLLAILLAITLSCVACSDDGGSSDSPSRTQRLHTISCPTTSYAIESGGVVDVEFVVDEPGALFNYAVSTIGCQVQLRTSGKITETPKELSLEHVALVDGGAGTYCATIKDSGEGEMYSRSISIVVKLEGGELVVSNPITITSANYVGGITGVTISKSHNSALRSDVSFTWDAKERIFNGHIEEYVTDREFTLSLTTDGVDRVEYNGELFVNNSTLVDLNGDATIVAYSGEYTLSYTLHLECFTGLPIVTITTPGGKSVDSKDIWVEGSRLSIDGMATFESLENVEMSIRGRGNSTWGYEKKAYNVKFKEKQRVLGMPKHKRWVLLANYMDRTLLRNRVAYYLASQTSLAWTPRCEFVELILNGEHLGQYLLCEQVRVDNDRIDITEMTPSDNSGDAVTGGYLLELDFHFDHQWQWYSSQGIPFSVKYPDEDELTTPQLEWIKSHIEEVEAAIYGSNFKDPTLGYRRYIDPQSFIDYWLIYEICVNHEIANPGSVYIYKDRNGKLYAGPVWDFDWGTFSYEASPAAQWGLFMTHAWWYSRLFGDEEFFALARERWAILKPRFESVYDFIARERKAIERSWYKNFDIWTISTNINGDERLSYGEAVDRLESITRERIELIDDALR